MPIYQKENPSVFVFSLSEKKELTGVNHWARVFFSEDQKAIDQNYVWGGQVIEISKWGPNVENINVEK